MAEQSQEANMNEGQFVFRTLTKMSDARAKEEIDEAFAYFTDAYQATMAYHDIETRLKLERDMVLYYKTEQEAETKYKNDSDRKEFIKRLKRFMVDTHKYFCYAALPNMQLQNVEKEAEVDYGSMTLEDYAAIVRTNSGMADSLPKVEKVG